MHQDKWYFQLYFWKYFFLYHTDYSSYTYTSVKIFQKNTTFRCICSGVDCYLLTFETQILITNNKFYELSIVIVIAYNPFNCFNKN